MYLKQLEIEGYKNFHNPFSITLSKGLNVLVGENGSGKSAIVDAIRLLFPEDEFGRNTISDTDFNRPFEEPTEKAKSFRLRASFANLTPEEQVAFLPWADLEGHAFLTLMVENKENHYGRYKRMLWGGVSRASMFESELFDAINCIYLPPLRDAEAKLREGKASRLARLLKTLNQREIKEAQQNNTLHPIEQKVKTFNESLAQDSNESIVKANMLIRERLIDVLGTVFGQDTHILFAETSFNRIVESLRLLFFPEANATVKPEQYRSLQENSLGYNNLLYLATVLAELTKGIGPNDEPEYLRLLLIEEPEAHLHPQLQMRLLKYLKKTAEERGVQVIVTTHSPVLASSVSLNSLIHLSSTSSGQTAVPLNSCGISEDSCHFLDRWLDVTKSVLLFAKGVILVEGISEAMLLPPLAKQVLKEFNSKSSPERTCTLPDSLEDGGVSVINMNGRFFEHFFHLYVDLKSEGKSVIPVRCAGITDNDPPSGSNPTLSSPVQGKNPILQLVDAINASNWARLFHNKLKTFEYDLAMEADNLNVLVPIAKSLLQTDGPVKRQFEEYERVDWGTARESEKKDAASYLLDHIEKLKGEFAQVLASKLDTSNQSLKIPEYIRKAVIWACGGNPDDA